jgi:hypothetical protein
MMMRRMMATGWRKAAVVGMAGTLFAGSCDAETLARISVALQAVADYDEDRDDPSFGDLVDDWWDNL